MQNRRGFNLTPIASLGHAPASQPYGTNSPNRLPARSDQVAVGQPGSAGANGRQVSPSRSFRVGGQNSASGFNRNSSDNVAAILGGSGSGAHGSAPPQPPPAQAVSGFQRPATRSRSEIRTPAKGAGASPWFRAPGARDGGAATTDDAVPNSAPPTYDCRVLASSGRVSSQKIQLACGVGSTQGMRPTMEDAHLTMLDVPIADGSTMSLFAVLDGHCGRRVADLGIHYLPECLFAHPLLGQNNAAALVESVLQTDKAVFRQMGHTDGGSTLTAAVVHNRMLFVANLGDARAVLFDGNAAVPMSIDHKPMDAAEQQRIVRCGGMVHFGRVNGCLAVSRALGDFEFKFSSPRYPNKEFQVSNIADIRQINLTDATKFLILACDGLWDVLSNDDAAAYVNNFLNAADLRDLTRALTLCAQQLCQYAVEQGSMDNVSVVIVYLHAGDVPPSAGAGAAAGGPPPGGSPVGNGSAASGAASAMHSSLGGSGSQRNGLPSLGSVVGRRRPF